jgi:hypothetical protein
VYRSYLVVDNAIIITTERWTFITQSVNFKICHFRPRLVVFVFACVLISNLVFITSSDFVELLPHYTQLYAISSLRSKPHFTRLRIQCKKAITCKLQIISQKYVHLLEYLLNIKQSFSDKFSNICQCRFCYCIVCSDLLHFIVQTTSNTNIYTM